MKNLDGIKNNLAINRQELFNSIKNGTEEQQKNAMNDLFQGIQDNVMNAARAEIGQVNDNMNDNQILANRGNNKVLTSKERKYFNAVIEHNSFDGIDEIFPTTIVEDVMSNLREEHPILSRIDIRNTEALVKYIFAKPTNAGAYWGDICSDIRQMIIKGFEVVNLESFKLSGFVPLCKGMLELGPAWLATYVTEIMEEIMQTSLELAVVDGDGKQQPVGMTRSLKGVVDGVYPVKTKVKLADFKPASLAGLRGALAKAKTDKGEVVILVNPITYWSKVFSNLVIQSDNGTWVADKLPTGETIIQSHAVPENTLIYGVLKNYFLAVSGKVRINKYTETLAIEDMDLFIAKFYGNGRPKDADAFFIADVTDIAGATLAEPDKAPLP